MINLATFSKRYIHIDLVWRRLTFLQTVGAAFGFKSVEVAGGSFTVGIWVSCIWWFRSWCRILRALKDMRAWLGCIIEMPVQPPFVLVHSYTPYCSSLLSDLTAKETFKRVEFWISELRANEPSCRIYIVGNKRSHHFTALSLTSLSGFTSGRC